MVNLKKMSKFSKLLQVTNEEKKAILEHYNMTEDDFEENVNILKEWMRQSEHLPKDDDDHKLRIVLLNSKMSLEKAKHSLEGYYRVRTRYSADLFDKMVPFTKDYRDGKRLVITAILPKLTPDLCRVTVFKIADPNGDASDAYLYNIIALMMAEIRIMNDLCLSNILICDFEFYGWKNLIKFTPAVNQKLVDILISVNLRIHSIHFINLSPFVDQVMKVLKGILPTKIVGKVITHNSHESLAKHIPRECIPSNYGGLERSVEELHEEWCKSLEESADIFEKLLTIKSTEKIELGTDQQDMYGCGVEGSFKKLALD